MTAIPGDADAQQWQDAGSAIARRRRLFDAYVHHVDDAMKARVYHALAVATLYAPGSGFLLLWSTPSNELIATIAPVLLTSASVVAILAFSEAASDRVDVLFLKALMVGAISGAVVGFAASPASASVDVFFSLAADRRPRPSSIDHLGGSRVVRTIRQIDGQLERSRWGSPQATRRYNPPTGGLHDHLFTTHSATGVGGDSCHCRGRDRRVGTNRSRASVAADVVSGHAPDANRRGADAQPGW
jgi:hypothetical protein